MAKNQAMRYRRADVPGATYFFALNAGDRRGQVLQDHVQAPRHRPRQVRARHPFELDAIVVLPEHLHMLMTLPRDDADFERHVDLRPFNPVNRAAPDSTRLDRPA